MTLFDNTDFRNRAVRAGSLGPRTGFFENLAAGFQQGDLGTSDALRTRLYSETNRIREQLFAQGLDAPDPPTPKAGSAAMTPRERQPEGEARGFDQELQRFANELAELAEKNPEAVRAAGAPTSVQGIMDEVRKSYRQTQEEFRSTAIRSGFSGDLGRFVGQLAGGMADPIALASMAAGAPWTAGIVRTAAIEAGIAGATEVPIQAMVQQDRTELGLDAGVGRALENIALATAGGGILGGGLRGIARGGSKIAGLARRLREEAPERVLDSAELNAATRGEIELDDVARRDPFIDVSAGRRQFEEIMGEDVRRIMRDADVSQRTPAAPANREAVEAIGEGVPSRVASEDIAETVRLGEQAGIRFQSRVEDAARGRSERSARQIVADQINETGERKLAENIEAVESSRRDLERAVEFRERAAQAENKKSAAALRGNATRLENAVRRLFRERELDLTDRDMKRIARGEDEFARARDALEALDVPVRDGEGTVFPADTIAARLRDFANETEAQPQPTPQTGPARASEAASEDVAEQDRLENLEDELVQQDIHRLRERVRNLPEGEEEPLVPDPENPEEDIRLSEALDELDEEDRIADEIADCIGRTR